ncbi:MAG: sodium:solute symporter family protein [Acidobacteriota bacterium]|nr:sodium:solute symporter family protein [Acidobacteriota bacterium]
MTDQVIVVLSVLAAYMAVIVFIGFYSSRFSKGTMEDYHMGSRSFKSYVLFSAVFGANISAVTLTGVPGAAYHLGWVMWPYFATSWAWCTPLLFYTVGSRSWLLGQKYGYMTVSEVVGNRWKSQPLAIILSLVLIIYTVPYLMTGLLGAGRTLEALTDGYITLNWSMVLVATAVLTYLLLGGMRGAAWVNTFQTTIFMVGSIAIFAVIANALGGPSEATTRVMDQSPELITRSKMTMRQFFSYGIIVAFSPIVFPQLFMRLLTGRDPKTLKRIMCFYPIPALVMMFLMATLGMWGRTAIPGLEGAQSDAILPMLLTGYTPIWMMGILGAAAFAAMMSTMDSQLLSVTTMITRDFFSRSRLAGASETTMVRISRILVFVLAILALILAVFSPAKIITIIEFALGGFACLLAPVVAALYWKRCTHQAAIWSVITSQICIIGLETGLLPESLKFGFLSGLPAIVMSIVVLVAVTYLTPPPQDEGTRDYFELFSRAKEKGHQQ